MKVINSLKKNEINTIVNQTIEEGTILKTDGSNSYNDLKTDYIHQPTIAKKKELPKLLPWVHTMISNAKRLLLDVHHRIDDDFLQNYLNEFVYKVNRRYFDCIFERLLTACVSYRWDYLGETSG